MMKRWLIVTLLALTIGALTIGGFVFVVIPFLSVISIFSNPEHLDKNEIAYSAKTEIDGFTFEVTLFRNHPLLAEYRKELKIIRGDKKIHEQEFTDSGGLATFYLLRQNKNVIY